MNTVKVKQGSIGVEFRGTLTLSRVASWVGAVIQCRLRSVTTGECVASWRSSILGFPCSGTIDSSRAANVAYVSQDGDLDIPEGKYHQDWRVWFLDGDKIPLPNDEFNQVVVLPDICDRPQDIPSFSVDYPGSSASPMIVLPMQIVGGSGLVYDLRVRTSGSESLFEFVSSAFEESASNEDIWVVNSDTGTATKISMIIEGGEPMLDFSPDSGVSTIGMATSFWMQNLDAGTAQQIVLLGDDDAPYLQIV
jgi:hypothetical protein